MVVLKELIFSSFYFVRVWWFLKELIFNSCMLGSGVVVLKELIFWETVIFLFLWEVVVVLKELFLQFHTLRGCGGLERLIFYS